MAEAKAGDSEVQVLSTQPDQFPTLICPWQVWQATHMPHNKEIFLHGTPRLQIALPYLPDTDC